MTLSEIKGTVKTLLRTGCAAISPLKSRKTPMTVSQARKTLEDCWAKKETTALTENRLVPVTCDLQIVIPAYNVEDYLEACMESVLNQKTKYSYRVVLVDDGAKDKTPEICDKYLNDPRVTVIHQKNRGLSGARNTGMRTLFGTYVLFVDSDDLLCEGAVEGLLDTAYTHDADLVEGGAYYLQGDRQTVMHRYAADAAVSDPYAQIHGHAWGKLYRRELFEHIGFPEGYWYEDSVMSFLLFSMAKSIWVSRQMVSFYRINQEGIVKSSVGKPRAVETYWLTEQLLQQRQQLGLPMDAAFSRFLLLQIRLNQLRLSDLGEEIQESAFRLTCDLLEGCFEQIPVSLGEKNLIRSLKEKDFGMFRMCCKFF